MWFWLSNSKRTSVIIIINYIHLNMNNKFIEFVILLMLKGNYPSV